MPSRERADSVTGKPNFSQVQSLNLGPGVQEAQSSLRLLRGIQPVQACFNQGTADS